jgi:hypothetical protein
MGDLHAQDADGTDQRRFPGLMARARIARRFLRTVSEDPPIKVVKEAVRAIYDQRPRCGAHCRSTGQPCQMRVWVRHDGSLARRCRLHGGMSTGPRTAEGLARTVAALREGYDRWRAGKRKQEVPGTRGGTSAPERYPYL